MKIMRRKIFPLLALFLCASSVFSQDSSLAAEYSFVVWFHDGGRVSFPLDSRPVVTHREGTLVVSSDGSEVDYLHSSVRKFTLEEVLYEELVPTPDPTPDPSAELYFVAWLHNGARISFPFAERPRLTYSDGDIVVTTDEEELRYAHDEVHKFTLSDEDISQEGETTDIAGNALKSRWHRQGDVMLFTGCTAGERVTICNAAGQQVAQYAIAADGTLQVPLSRFDEGMYIVKTESITYKFMKR